MADELRTFVVQRFRPREIGEESWTDVAEVKAVDAGEALMKAMRDPSHRVEAATYRVSEQALLVNVSINLETVEQHQAGSED